MNRFILSTATALLIAAPAFAQTAAPAKPAASATTAAPNSASTAGTGTSGTGMTMGTTSTVAIKYVQVSPADVMASRLDDINVYNNQNETVGEISDFVIKDGKTISGVVVSVGGFLGLGERYVLLDPSSIVLATQDGTMRAFVNTSKEELTKAPAFKYDRNS
jgi:sporulation protein YlmC with PRC-barrel domain